MGRNCARTPEARRGATSIHGTSRPASARPSVQHRRSGRGRSPRQRPARRNAAWPPRSPSPPMSSAATRWLCWRRTRSCRPGGRPARHRLDRGRPPAQNRLPRTGAVSRHQTSGRREFCTVTLEPVDRRSSTPYAAPPHSNHYTCHRGRRKGSVCHSGVSGFTQGSFCAQRGRLWPWHGDCSNSRPSHSDWFSEVPC